MFLFISINPCKEAMNFIGEIRPSLGFQLYRVNVITTNRNQNKQNNTFRKSLGHKEINTVQVLS